MIAFLEGTVVEKGADRVVVSAGGIGYGGLTRSHTAARLPPAGRQARLFTRLAIRGEGMGLYAFSSSD